jgi:hypothetical protein
MNNRLYVALLLGAFSAAPPLRGQRTVEDPLAIFAKMMPVLSHDRCVNCHGATDAFKGFYHPGAVSQKTPCVSCHTANARWDIAPRPMAFFQKTTRQLCDHFAVNLAVGEGTAVHLEHDDLIGLAFAGRRGNAVTPQFTEKPPMTRVEFVRAYRNWVQQTGGGCSSWEGTITRTETVAANDTGPGLPDFRQFGPMTVTAWQHGTHTITVTIKDGKALVSTTLDGEVNRKEVTKASNCEVTGHIRDAYSLVSTKAAAAARGPAAGGATAPLAAVGDGSVRVGLSADGSYRIHVVPPADKTQTTSTTTISATCPMPNVAAPAHTDTFDWDPWVFEIAAKLPDPRVRTHLEGQTVEMLERSASRSFGLAFMGAAVGRLNETNVKFKVTTTWDLKRAP